MRLPSLSVIIASQALIWCIAGAWIHGSMILLYPLAWVAIATMFFFHNKMFPIKLPAPNVPSSDSWANSRKQSDGIVPTDVDAPIDQSTTSI